MIKKSLEMDETQFMNFEMNFLLIYLFFKSYFLLLLLLKLEIFGPFLL